MFNLDNFYTSSFFNFSLWLMVDTKDIAALKKAVGALVDAFDELLDVLEDLGIDVLGNEVSTKSQ